jgi:two-component system chemotaxis response regulator CheY
MATPTCALIVDDEQHVRLYVKLLLKELGITLTWEADNGQKGVELAVQNKPELIMMDINLPVMSGLEALAEIQRLEPDMPVVMMTAQSSMATVRDAANLGAIGYILKHHPKSVALRELRGILAQLDDGTPSGGPAAGAPGGGPPPLPSGPPPLPR